MYPLAVPDAFAQLVGGLEEFQSLPGGEVVVVLDLAEFEGEAIGHPQRTVVGLAALAQHRVREEAPGERSLVHPTLSPFGTVVAKLLFAGLVQHQCVGGIL